MSARAGNSIRSGRPSMSGGAGGGSATRRDGALHSATARSPQRAHPAAASAATKEPQPAAPSPPTAPPRPASHSRNIPFHRGSARSGLPATVLPPAVLPRPQRGASEPHSVSPAPNGEQRPRASSYNVAQQAQLPQQRQQQQQYRASPRQHSAQTTLNSSSYTGVGAAGPAPSSAPAPYPLPRERGVYPAPHSAARPSPAPRQRSSSNERPPHPTSPSNHTAAAQGRALMGEKPQRLNGASPSLQQQQQQQRTQPSPPRVQARVGGVYLELMEPIRPARGTPPPQPTSQSARAPYQHAQQVANDASAAFALRPSPPSSGARRDRSREDSRDRGTGTEDLEAYAQAAHTRHSPQRHAVSPPQQQYYPQQYSSPSYLPEASPPPESYAVSLYQPPPQQQQQAAYTSAARPMDYYSLAPSLRLGQHQHVRYVAPRAAQNAPPQPQQQQLALMPPPAASPVAHQHDPELSTTSFISDTGSTRSSRTRHVFRRQPFATGALPTGSPYGARPTYAVVMPRSHRVPAGLYAPSSQAQPQQQQHQSGYVVDVEPTVEEPQYVTEAYGGRVVEYDPEPPQQQYPQQQYPQQQRRLPAAPPRARPVERVPPPLPQHYHRQQQEEQVYAEQPVQRRPPPPPPVQHVAIGGPMRQVVHYYPAHHQQQQQPLYESTSLTDDAYADNSYSYDHSEDDGRWRPAAPAQQQQQRRRPPPPPPPLPPAHTAKTKRRAKQRVTQQHLPPPQPNSILEQQQPQQHHSRHHSGRAPSSGSQQDPPPPTQPPLRALPADSNPDAQLYDGAAHQIVNDYDDYSGEDVHTYPTRYELLAAAGRRPSAQDQSEQPSSATLAAPLQPGYRPEELSFLLDSGAAAAPARDEVRRLQQQQQQRRRGSPPAGRRPRPPPPPPPAQTQQQQQHKRPTPKPANNSTGRPEELYKRPLSTYTEAAPVRHPLPPPPPPQPQLEDVEEEEGKEEEVIAEEQQPQQTRLSQRPSLAKEHNESLSFDLDSTVDPEDVLAQQEAKKLADELVRRSLLPPTPYVAPQAMSGPAPYSDEDVADGSSEEEERASENEGGAARTLAGTTAMPGGTTTDTSAAAPATTVVVPLSAVSPPAEAPQRTTVAQASVVSVDSGVPHSVHVALGKEANTVDLAEGGRLLNGLQLSAPEQATPAPTSTTQDRRAAPVRVPTPRPPEEMAGTSATEAATSEECGNDSLREDRRVSHDDATEVDIDVSLSSEEELDAPPPPPPQQQQQQLDHQRHSSDVDADAPRAEATLRPTGSASGDRAAVTHTPAQLASAQPQPPQKDATEKLGDEEEEENEPQPLPPPQRQVTTAPAAAAPQDEVTAAAVEEGEEDIDASPLDVGDRYGYVDPLEEAAMDAAYMLDTLEDQYVRVNEETGEEMEDLVHVVELNRFDRTVEPRYFLPKGQYSDVLPLLRYPVTAVPTTTTTAASPSHTAGFVGGEDGAVPDLLTYVPLSEAGYVNLCAVIWLSRFNRDDIPRLLALTQGPHAQQQQQQQQTDISNEVDEAFLAQTSYFDHPSATVVDLLDSVTAHRVRSVIDDACAQSGESFATACARLADRNNLSYLPPSVWQQTTTASTLCVTSMADHVTEVLLAATVPQEAARRQAARRATLHDAERRAQKTWSLFLGALPWDTEEAVDAETYAAMPTASARLAYAFMYKARLANLDGGLGALTFSTLSAQIPDTAVMDSLLMQEKLRLALLYSYKNVAACCALRQRAVRQGCVSSSLCNSQVNDKDDSNSRDGGSPNANANGWNSPVFSAYLQLWEGAKNAMNVTPADSLPQDTASAADVEYPTEHRGAAEVNDDNMEAAEEDVVDLYSIAVQLNCFFPTKTERGMHQLCAALIEDLIAMEALMVPEEVRTPEGAVLTDHTAIVDALVVEGAQAMRHVIMTLSEAGYTSTVSTDDYVGTSGRADRAGLRAAMEEHLVLFEPAVMYFLSSPVPVDALFRYTRVSGPPSMQPHTRGRKSTFIEVLRLQHMAETIQYAMEMQDAILVASQYNHLVAVHRRRIKQQQQLQQKPGANANNTRATPRTLAEELQMDAVVVGQSMDLILNAAPLLAREHGSDASLLAELSNGETRGETARAAAAADEDVMLGQEDDDAAAAANADEVLVRAVLVALCCADPMKPVSDVQEYLRHLLTLYAEVRDEHNNPVDAADPMQVAHARVAAAELAMVDWFGQTAADGTLMPGAPPARCDETRINAEELAALCPRVLARRVGLASSAVADAAAVISASAGQHPRPGMAGGQAGVEDSVLLADTASRPPRAR